MSKYTAFVRPEDYERMIQRITRFETGSFRLTKAFNRCAWLKNVHFKDYKYTLVILINIST